jgi:hypothetical protein
MGMSVDRASAVPLASWDRLQRLGLACAASGVLGIIIGLLTLAYPAAVPSGQWSYPFPVDVQWVVSVVLAATHGLTLAGFVGVLAATARRRGRAADVGLWVAIVGFAGLVICELLSGAIGGDATSASVADSVSSAFGIASVLTAVGSLVAGIIIWRRGVWQRVGGWALIASGVVMLVLVTPASITGNEVFTSVALSLWSATFIPLGRAVSSSAA